MTATRESEPRDQPDRQAPLRAEHDQDQLVRRHRDAGADREQHQVPERQDAEVGTAQAGQVLLDAAEGREQHVRQRLGQVVAERLEDQVVRPGVLAEHRGARHTADREGVEVAAAVVHQVGARQARPVAADRLVRLPAEHGPERMPDDGVLPDRLGRRGRHRRRHQAPHAGPEQGQAHAHDEVAEHVRAHQDHRQGAEAVFAAQQAQSRHGPAHEHERHAQTHAGRAGGPVPGTRRRRPGPGSRSAPGRPGRRRCRRWRRPGSPPRTGRGFWTSAEASPMRAKYWVNRTTRLATAMSPKAAGASSRETLAV